MSNITKHLNNINLSAIALPSNIRYGNAIFKRGGISIVKKNETEIEAWVGGLAGNSIEGGGSKRHVRFWVDKDQLFWRCTGNPKGHEIFCKHCVAAVLFERQL